MLTGLLGSAPVPSTLGLVVLAYVPVDLESEIIDNLRGTRIGRVKSRRKKKADKKEDIMPVLVTILDLIYDDELDDLVVVRGIVK